MCAGVCQVKILHWFCWQQLMLKTHSHSVQLVRLLDQNNSHTTAVSDSTRLCFPMRTWWSAFLIMLPYQRPRGSRFASDTNHTWLLLSAHLDGESCYAVTCWGVVSFHASPPPDEQQVPRRPLDTVCMRRAKCPPAAGQGSSGLDISDNDRRIKRTIHRELSIASKCFLYMQEAVFLYIRCQEYAEETHNSDKAHMISNRSAD